MDRDQTIRAIEKDPNRVWDIVIIGGGATGLGAGVDGASRGFSTLLLEQYDFSKGTSSRSTKLVHGGVRYLAQGDISLVLEALEERGLIRQNAPHLFKNLKFIIPSYEWWGGTFYTIGMKVYDMMSGKLDLGPSEYISRDEILAAIPNLVEEDLKGGVIYHDGQFDDSRLAINLAQTIVDNGGHVINYCKVTGMIKDKEAIIRGVECLDTETNEEYNINARTVINATGVFVDDIIRMDDKNHVNSVVPSQGVHVVLDKSYLRGGNAIVIPRTNDGRVLFAVPWHGKVVVGTTDTLVESASIEPIPLDEEIDFILNTAGRYLRKAPTRRDVLSVFAGLRALAAPEKEGQETKEISRGHKITISPSGLITMTGGKWTTYRKMGEDLIDKAISLGGLEQHPCVTRNMPIHGYVKNVDRESHMYVYGSDLPQIRNMIDENPVFGEKIHPDLPYVKAEVVWAVRHEMARTIEDVLARRTRALFLDARTSLEMAEIVGKVMGRELHKRRRWRKNQEKIYKEISKTYILN